VLCGSDSGSKTDVIYPVVGMHYVWRLRQVVIDSWDSPVRTIYLRVLNTKYLCGAIADNRKVFASREDPTPLKADSDATGSVSCSSAS
jgi:hypothetical protein